MHEHVLPNQYAEVVLSAVVVVVVVVVIRPVHEPTVCPVCDTHRVGYWIAHEILHAPTLHTYAVL